MNRKQIIFIHILFWLLIFLIYGISAYYSFNSFTFLYSFIPRRLLDVPCFYLAYFTTSKKLFSFKNFIKYFLLFFVFICLYAFLYGYVLSYMTVHFINTTICIDSVFMSFYMGAIANSTTIFIFGTFMKFSILWYNGIIEKKELEKQNIANELALLRAQINPHFFFNTLNNIKSFASINSDKTLYIIDKLSDTMSYILYESSTEKIELKKEIDFIKDFIELQRIRYNDPEYIKLNISGNYSKIIIPPLLFIPFIENAFKHGNKLEISPGIKINFNIEKNCIHFEITNYLKNDDEISRTKGGFGLTNIQRRLDLLFRKNHKLEIEKNNKQYIVKLKIILNDN